METFFVVLLCAGVLYQVCQGQEPVECFIGDDSCSIDDGGARFNVSSSVACCQSQQNTSIFYLLNNHCIPCPVVAFEFRPVGPIIEGSTNYVEVCLVPIEGDIITSVTTITVNTVEETALSYNDYIPLIDEELVFIPGNTEQCVNISLVDDDSYEEQEFFRIMGMSNTDYGLVIGDMMINIADNDNIVISISDPQPIDITESDPFVSLRVEVSSGKLETALTLLASTGDVSATGGEDYIPLSNVSLTLSGQVSFQMVEVQLREDSLVEGPKVFRLSIELMNPDGLRGVAFDGQSRDIVIRDNDRATIGFITPSLSIGEGSPAIDVCFIVKSGDIMKDIIIDVSPMGQAAEGVDFSNVTMEYLINGDVSDGCVSFGPIDDLILENDEAVSIALRTDDRDVDIDIDQFSITIIDNDEVELRFANSSKVYSEGTVTDTVCVEMIPPLGGIERSVTVSVELSSDSESAIQLESHNLTFFNDAVRVKCISLIIMGDSLVEGNGEVTFILSSTDDAVNIIDPIQSFVIRDNVEFQVCTISDQLIVETFHASGSNGFVYDFSEGCEHVLLSSCNSSVEFEVRIDFLHNNFSTKRVFINYEGEKIVVNENNTITNLSGDLSEITIVFGANEVNVQIPVVGISLVFNASSINIHSTLPNSHPSFINGLCGSTSGQLLLSNCNDIFNITDAATEISDFIDDFKVELTKLVLRPQRVECGLTGNSSVIGDPLYSTPILPEVSHVEWQAPLSLCYEIHGSPDVYFNLVTDECTSVNAHYAKPLVADHLNIIDLITVVAVDNENTCHQVQVEVSGCKVSFDGVEIKRSGNLSVDSSYNTSPLLLNGIEIRLYSNRVHISVPNCADVSLSMWIACQHQLITDPYTDAHLGYAPMLKFIVNGGVNIHEQSHGLIGQFWNMPVNITKYNGQIHSDIGDRSDYFTVSFSHRHSVQTRHFVGIVHDVIWSQEEGVCLFVGNRQGGPISEVEDPNDPVIEGDYRDYIINSRFDTAFKYSIFRKEECDV